MGKPGVYCDWSAIGYIYNGTDELVRGTFSEKIVADCREDALAEVHRRHPGFNVQIHRLICKALDIDERL